MIAIGETHGADLMRRAREGRLRGRGGRWPETARPRAVVRSRLMGVCLDRMPKELSQVRHSTLLPCVRSDGPGFAAERFGPDAACGDNGACWSPTRPCPRVIPDPGFAGDDGSADPALSAALAAWAAGAADRTPTSLAALQQSRLLVPVVAVLGEVEYDDAGLAHDKSSDMATVLLQGADGRLALLAFTGTATLPAGTPRPARCRSPPRSPPRSALQDGAEALVVDLAGPVRFVVEGDDLRGLAQGWTLARVGGGHRLDSARRRNRRLAFRVDRSVPPYHPRTSRSDPQAEARTIVSHPHRPPHASTGRRVRSRRPRPAACDVPRRDLTAFGGTPIAWEASDWLPLAAAEAFCCFGPLLGRDR